MKKRFIILLLCSVILWPGTSWAEAPRVVVSIKPIHSLAAALMEGVGEPFLLVKGNASPHDYALRPSDASALSEADIVLWMGPDLEGFLAKPLAVLAPGKTVLTFLTFLEADALRRLAVRTEAVWDDHEGHENHEDHHAHGPHSWDPHAWLDVNNARAMAGLILAVLIEKDPEHAAMYQKNGQRLDEALEKLDAELTVMLAPVKTKPFIVFHDAYLYLEKAYGLNAVAAFTLHPESPPKPRQVQTIRRKIQALEAVCLFTEPQFPAASVNALTEGTSVRLGVLDPEGSLVPEGSAQYITFMRQNAENLVQCLGDDTKILRN